MGTNCIKLYNVKHVKYQPIDSNELVTYYYNYYLYVNCIKLYNVKPC